MRGAQQMVDVHESGFREQPQRLARDDQHLAAHDGFDPHAVGGDFPVGGGVLAEREQGCVR
jgi:hypothetical protein